MISATMVDAELAKLKDFQRRTVEYVFRRMYRDDPPARRFLVADEVGLGKTMVARGLIARAIHHLQDSIRRIDVVYVCSNAAIAGQNLQRLDVLGQKRTFATRLTLLPTELPALEQSRINFVSFTPGTTFDLKSRAGRIEERALLFRMLEGQFGLRRTALRNGLQVNVSNERWDRYLEGNGKPISTELEARFRSWLKGAPVLRDLEELCERFGRRREKVADEDRSYQYQVVGALRRGLAKQCISALEPDLVIIDEFQRFKHLLHGEDEAAELAQDLFDHADARVLLLSATPYRMLTLAHEAEDDHHRDFLETVRFLADDEGASCEALRRNLAQLRHALMSEHEHGEAGSRARAEIESVLRRVMCRTERVASTRSRDAMLQERRSKAGITRRDIEHAVEIAAVSKLVGADDPIEYWKSAPYLLNFMDGYELKQRLTRLQIREPEKLVTLAAGIRSGLRKDQFERYAAIESASPRVRSLMHDTVDAGGWRLLWLPPSVPYIAPAGPYAGLGASAATKALVFSAWQVVPKALAVLLSYEAERRMVGAEEGALSYERLGRERRPLLTFRVDADGRATGMPALALLYPSATLAAHVDPLALALELGRGQPAELENLRRHIAARVQPLVERIVVRRGADVSGPVDQRWYWAIPALLDEQHHRSAFDWAVGPQGLSTLFRGGEEEDGLGPAEDESVDGLARHVLELERIVRGEERLGRVPDDLGSVVADFALASPAVCASRALLRVSRLSSAWDPHVLSAAASVASGFRTLFNVPESISLLRGAEELKPYWRRVLEYCVDGNLQAVLDEYAHLLVETTGCVGAAGHKIVDTISKTMRSALSPRTSNLALDELRIEDGRVQVDTFRVRCRYALRFGELHDDQGAAIARAETVRDAFNSPFRPFVLASTSIGQEGLDFHAYCHAVYHWNLPSNPVDLEQREGRVHRYKGHAVRRNIGLRYGLPALSKYWNGDGDPWTRLFELAAADRPPHASELIPYWIFETEGGVQVERRIPLLPLSREVDRIDVLKRQLAVYRLAFGQPRQDDLLAYLASLQLAPETIDAWRISLEPEPFS